MRLRQFATCLAIGTSLIALSPSALAFTDSEARQAIIELRQQLRTLSETSQNASLQLAQRIDMLEQEIARLRAMIEELGGPRAGQFVDSSASAPEQVEDIKEQSAFDGSMDRYRQGDFKEAIQSLTAFLTLYPDSSLAPTAQFYLGSSKYAEKDFRGAISVLKAMAAENPDHRRAPDALLVAAGSEFELNDRAAAKATLQEIVSKYPDSTAAQSAGQRLQLL